MNISALKFTDLKNAVYKNFKGFKANAASIPAYELRKGTAGDILNIKEERTEYPTGNARGFCDGKDIFINSGDTYSMPVRRENTFYFLGVKAARQATKHIAILSSGLNDAADTGPEKKVYKPGLKYYQADMETGQVVLALHDLIITGSNSFN